MVLVKKKIDRTLGYSTSVWLEDVSVVTRGNKDEHEKKLFDLFSTNWKKPDTE